ncbi:hypothetical protein HpMS68_06250 [Helicobacter pylori]
MFENALKYCKEKAIDLLTGFVPKTYSMTEECNILGLYDDTFIITKQENLVAIMSLQGLSYSNLMQKDLEGYFDTRQNVLNTISKDIQLRIVAKRRKEFINQSPNIDNPYAKAIITQFEGKEIYKTEYFLVFESITSNVKSFFEKKKLEMTTSINEDYFIIEFQNQSTFCACVGIKNYESEEISSLPISTLLHTQIELDLIFHIRSLGQFESLNFLKTKKKLTLSKIVKNDIDDYIELVQANRLSMQECALNLVLRAKSKAKLDKSLKEILSLLNNAGLGSVTETIGLKPSYFSFFPITPISILE